MVAIFAALTFSFTSCGDDDDEPDDPDSDRVAIAGRIIAKYERGEELSLFACNAKWWKIDDVKVEDDNGYWVTIKQPYRFSVELTEDDPSKHPLGFYIIEAYWNLSTTDDLKVGNHINIDSTNWDTINDDDQFHSCKDSTGDVIVKEIKDDKITLEFKNFCFSWMYHWSVGDSDYKDIVVNGEITFTKDEW